MRTFIFLISCLVLFACEHTPPPTQEDVQAKSPVKVLLEERVRYEADSTIKVVYQIDANTNAKHGNYKEYDNATQALMVEREYNQDKITGTEKLYFPDGKADAIITYKDGLHYGPFKYFYPNGQLKQNGEYVEGKIEGMLRGFYMDGTLKEEVTHQEGVTEGPFKEYNENGTLKAEGRFTTKGDEENLEYGLIKLYDENGELDRKMVCKDGQCCTIWTLAKGDVAPKNDLCKAIVKELGEAS